MRHYRKFAFDLFLSIRIRKIKKLFPAECWLLILQLLLCYYHKQQLLFWQMAGQRLPYSYSTIFNY